MSSVPDDFMLDLFRQEVATNAETLNNGLVQLEQNPDNAAMIEPLMRAAHSIKGAARVLAINSAVKVAHNMEECLVRAQRGELRLTSGQIDALLSGVDVLTRLAAHVGLQLAAWEGEHESEIASLCARLDAIAKGQETEPAPAVTPVPPEPVAEPRAKTRRKTNGTRRKASPETEPLESPPATAAPPDVVPARPESAAISSAAPSLESHERVVRVTAQHLSRLMGLAGESLVEARWLQPFADSLLNLKTQQSRLSEDIDDLLNLLPANIGGERFQAQVAEVRRKLADCHTVLAERIVAFENHARRSDDLNSRLYHEVVASRMRPFRDGIQGLPRLVRDLARQLGKKGQLEIAGEMTEVDREILDKLDAPLTHLLRNAVDHGLELPDERLAAGKPDTGTLRLEARHVAGSLSITVSDDGRGIDLARLRRKIVDRQLTTDELAGQMSEAELLEFLFLPGFSTTEQVTEVSGRGVGLDVVQNMVQAVGGQVRIESQLGQGTRFQMQLPLTLSVIRAVLVQIAGEPYAFPHNRIDGLVRLPRNNVRSLEGRQYFEVHGRNVGVVLAHQVLQLPAGEATCDDVSIVLFSRRNSQYGLIVDEFHGEQDLVVRPLDPRLGKVPDISAAAILDDGSPVLIADIDDLHRSIEKLLHEGHLKRIGQLSGAEGRRKRILVVDDSITVREVERQLLSSRGYEVEVAVDGVDGWNIVRGGGFDLVVSDIDMPRMNGIEFVRRIKSDPRLQATPVVIVSYKDREEDRRAGLDAGANYYLTKSSFHDDTLVQVVGELIGVV